VTDAIERLNATVAGQSTLIAVLVGAVAMLVVIVFVGVVEGRAQRKALVALRERVVEGEAARAAWETDHDERAETRATQVKDAVIAAAKNGRSEDMRAARAARSTGRLQ